MSREMKDSGIEWIGEIPSGWELERIKKVLIERKEMNKPTKTDFILSLTNNRGVIPYSEKGDIGNKSKEDLTSYKLAYPGDIVFNSMNAIIGSIGLSKYFGAVSPVYYMLRPRDSEDSVEYYNWVFQSKQFQENLKGYGNGIMELRMRISMNKLNTLEVPHPCSDEQIKISNFLNIKTRNIDSIIEKTKSTIEDYKLLKQSIITEAVTKGLDKNVEMEDSGIEWIGKIPKHWEIIKLKYLVDCNKASLGDNESPEYKFRYVDIGSVSLSNGIEKYEEIKFSDAPSRAKRKVEKGDVIVSTVRTYLKAIASIDDDDNVIVSTGFATLSPKNITPKYLEFACKANSFVEQVTALSTGISYPAINASTLINIEIIVPSTSEQREISRYLETKVKSVNKLIIDKESLVERLEAYKKSLIYEYVTGKKEVGE